MVEYHFIDFGRKNANLFSTGLGGGLFAVGGHQRHQVENADSDYRCELQVWLGRSTRCEILTQAIKASFSD
jgi:hypothetical protein